MKVKELLSVTKGIKTYEFILKTGKIESYNTDRRTNTVDARIVEHLDKDVTRVFAIKADVIRIDAI